MRPSGDRACAARRCRRRAARRGRGQGLHAPGRHLGVAVQEQDVGRRARARSPRLLARREADVRRAFAITLARREARAHRGRRAVGAGVVDDDRPRAAARRARQRGQAREQLARACCRRRRRRRPRGALTRRAAAVGQAPPASARAVVRPGVAARPGRGPRAHEVGAQRRVAQDALEARRDRRARRAGPRAARPRRRSRPATGARWPRRARPRAMASSAGRPKPSYSERNTATSAAA